eukprot:403372948
MGGIRDCCGYYCAFIMFIGVFFFVFTIILELTKNQFMLYHLQEPEFEKHGTDPLRYVGAHGAKAQAEEKVNNRVISMAIAIGINVVCILFCLGCVRIGAKKEAPEEEEHTEKIM